MLVPVSWLLDFAPIPTDVALLTDTFNELGLVVEGIRRVGQGIQGVVVAKVLETRPHPNADRVQLVEVDPGTGEPIQIVCGAFNFAAGDLVPLAPTGTHLSEIGLTIERRRVRGEWSNGMLCSGRELGLSDDGAGIFVLPGEASPGVPLGEALGIEADVVFDLDVGVNRPDAMCMAGVARDVAAKLRLPFAIGEPRITEGAEKTSALVSVVVESPDLCPRFTARVITGVSVGPSSELVSRRVTLAGMRPINNVVDASNYVMLELGQPSHPYDLALLPGRGLRVRRARPGEVVVTLDGLERTVGEGDDCLICDADGTPVGIGGVMGGATSEISDATTDVVLEAAFFTPMVIARTAKRLGLRTEASARFERGCDIEGIERASARYCELLGGGTPSAGMVDVRDDDRTPTVVKVRAARANAVLGTDLSDADIAGYLEPIGFQTAAAGEGALSVTVPSFRPDARIEIDIIEEVARHHGYANIERTVPTTSQVGRLTTYQTERRSLRNLLTGCGVTEAIGTMLVGPGDHARSGLPEDGIEAADPMVREESILRTSLRPGLLRAIEFNSRHRMPGADFFEIGHVYRRPAEPAPLPDEREMLTVALSGEGGAIRARHVWDAIVDAFKLVDTRLRAGDGPGLHPTRTAQALVDGNDVGFVGEIDPDVVAGWNIEGRVGIVEVDLEGLLAGNRRPDQVAPVSRFPSSDIDLAFTLPEQTPASVIEAALRDAGGELLVDIRLFDVFRGSAAGPGNRSLAYRLRLNAPDRTLTDTEIAAVRDACIAAATAAGGVLRG